MEKATDTIGEQCMPEQELKTKTDPRKPKTAKPIKKKKKRITVTRVSGGAVDQFYLMEAAAELLPAKKRNGRMRSSTLRSGADGSEERPAVDPAPPNAVANDPAGPVAAVETGFHYQFATVEEHVAALQENLLAQLERDLVDCGLEPVLRTAILIYLAKASPYAGRPISLQIRGDSESFKSMTVSIVCRLHPENDVVHRQNITWAALMDGFGRGGDLRRMTICLDENVESRKRDHDLMGTIRELTTKERVTRTKMQRGAAIDISLLGPATIIDCMLADTKLTDQDVNRFLVLGMPENPAVTAEICELNAERFDERGAQRRRLIDLISTGHRAFLGQLDKELTVNKPTALTGSNVSPRFDSSVFGLTCTVAWLQQVTRTVEDSVLTATIDDYFVVWNLLQQSHVLFPRAELSTSATQLLEKWKALTATRGNVSISRADLLSATASTMDPAAFGRIINELVKAGLAALVGHGPHGAKFHQLTDLGLHFTGTDLVAKLPTPESIR